LLAEKKNVSWVYRLEESISISIKQTKTNSIYIVNNGLTEKCQN